MATANLGRIGFVIKGAWSAGTYKNLDVVYHNNITWGCAVETTTDEPDGISTDWAKLVDGIGLSFASEAEVLAGTVGDKAISPATYQDTLTPVTNPLAMSQAIRMTEATSGSNGIKVLNNDDINFGTGDFTLVWEGSLPDWTPTSEVYLFWKRSNSAVQVVISLLSSGILSLKTSDAAGTGGNNIDLVDISDLDANSTHMIVVSATRTATNTLDINAGINGTFLANVQYTDVKADLTNALDLYISGLTTARYVSTTKQAILYNRALDADDASYLYRNGIDPADMWGSQTAVYESDFSAGSDVWVAGRGTVTGNVDGIGGEENCLAFYADNTDDSYHRIYRPNTTTPDKNQKITGKFYIPSTNTNINGIVVRDAAHANVLMLNNSTTDEWVSFSFIIHGDENYSQTPLFISTKNGSESFAGANDSGDDLIYFKDIVIYEVGATAAYLPENIQPVPGQWLDAANGNHALMPAEGCTLIRPENNFEIRWTNTWAGTSEMQYIGGTNQAILPEGNIRIEYITLTCTATGVDITIGDGSDADYFVTATALADYLDISSPTKRNHDGTNRDMTITPSGTYTGSITTTIVGKILD